MKQISTEQIGEINKLIMERKILDVKKILNEILDSEDIKDGIPKDTTNKNETT